MGNISKELILNGRRMNLLSALSQEWVGSCPDSSGLQVLQEFALLWSLYSKLVET